MSPVNVCPKPSIFGNIFSEMEKILTDYSIPKKICSKND